MPRKKQSKEQDDDFPEISNDFSQIATISQHTDRTGREGLLVRAFLGDRTRFAFFPFGPLTPQEAMHASRSYATHAARRKSQNLDPLAGMDKEKP